MEAEEKKRAEALRAQTEVSALHKEIKQDLVGMYDSLAKHLRSILDTTGATLENTEKIHKEAKQLTDITKDIQSKIGKVTDATDKIATTTLSYSDALKKNQSPPPSAKANMDPKVLGDLERKAKQILVELNEESSNGIMEKSLSEITAKANEALDSITESEKPDKVKVEVALKTKKGGLVLTLSSKEAVTWIKWAGNEMAFTDAFAKGSYIRERNYNLIVPRIPIMFDPEDKKHLREVEETNGFHELMIYKARWIKPIGHRRPD
jgi:hypothetical protein